MIELTTQHGYFELEIFESREFDDFYSLAQELEKNFKIEYTSKLDDFDSLYWDFQYQGIGMTISFNTFTGISINRREPKGINEEDKAILLEFKNKLNI
jgi:hypothetical protein